MTFDRLVFRVHAIQRMALRDISEAEVRAVLTTGEAIEEYPDDTPFPSRLVLGWVGSRPLHVVAADNPEEEDTEVSHDRDGAARPPSSPSAGGAPPAHAG